MSKYLIDTSIIIDYLRDHKPTVNLVDELLVKNNQFYISVLTQAELYSGKSSRKYAFKHALSGLMVAFKKIPLDESTAVKAGHLKRDYNVTLFDAIIAATAIGNRLILFTRDKDFVKIEGLKKLKVI